MSNIILGRTLRREVLGFRVERTTTVLPATTQAPIFTITGGRIALTHLVGEFTVAGSATVTTLKVTSNPVIGSDVDLSTAVAITSREVGSLVTLPVVLGGALSVTNAGAGGPSVSGFIIPIGSLDLVTSATNTGSVRWSMTFVPLDDGAFASV